MTNPIEPTAEKKPVFGCKICRHRASNRVGRIVSDWFKIPSDDRSWCYVMYENEAGYTHLVEYAQFFLPEGHQHYDEKIDVIENPVGTLEAQNKKMREALEKIDAIRSWYEHEEQADIAKEALSSLLP